MRTGRAMGTVGVALAVGVGVTLLFAPQSGARTRRLLRRKTEDFVHGTLEVYERLREKGNGAARILAYRLKRRLIPRKVAEHLLIS